MRHFQFIFGDRRSCLPICLCVYLANARSQKLVVASVTHAVANGSHIMLTVMQKVDSRREMLPSHMESLAPLGTVGRSRSVEPYASAHGVSDLFAPPAAALRVKRRHGNGRRLKSLSTTLARGEQLDTGTRRAAVSRRYFFRGLESVRSDFPKAAHFDCLLRDENDEDQRARTDYVDTLVNAAAGASNSSGSDTVKVAAEDLSALLADARPFSKEDARPICTLFQSLLSLLSAGKLEVAAREAQTQAEHLRKAQAKSVQLQKALNDHNKGIVAKLRRVEGRLEAERAAHKHSRRLLDEGAKELDVVRMRLRKYEPDETATVAALAHARTMVGGVRAGLVGTLATAQLNRMKSFLRQIPLFVSLDEDALGNIAAQLRPLEFKDGEAIITEGEEGDSLYIIDEGSAHATKKGITEQVAVRQAGLKEMWSAEQQAELEDSASQVRSWSSPNRKKLEREKILMEYRKGEWFGELALLSSDSLRAATVRAVAPTKCLQLPRSSFQHLKGSDGSTGIIRQCKERYDRINREALADGVTSGSMSLLEELQALPGGSVCCDCSEASDSSTVLTPHSPSWGSSISGALVCQRCSAIHRMLGTPVVGRVLSVKLDEWTGREVQSMRRGNAAVNVELEATLRPEDKITPDSTLHTIEDFIFSKYTKRSFVEGSGDGILHQPPWVRVRTMEVEATTPAELTPQEVEAMMLARLQMGSISDELLHSLGVAFLANADPHQLRELLELFMGDDRARVLVNAIVHEYEAQARKQELGEMMGKAKASVKAQVRLASELAALAGTHEVEATAAAQPGALKVAAGLAGSMSSAFCKAHKRSLAQRMSGLKDKARVLVTAEGNMLALQQLAANAHQRDFTIKQWHKHTKNLRGDAFYNFLYPPVVQFPCEKPIKVNSMKKLVSKIYETLVAEYYSGEHANHSHKKVGQDEHRPPPLQDYVEDSLLLQYGMPSLSRKTLMQMVATAHKFQTTDARIRTFAELTGMISPRHPMVALCRDEAQDFYFSFLVRVIPARRLSDSMCSVRTNAIGLVEAEAHVRELLYGGLRAGQNAELDHSLSEDLRAICQAPKKKKDDAGGLPAIGIDELQEFVLAQWSEMAAAQKAQLEELFQTHDRDGDGKLSIGEFTRVIEETTPEDASQPKVLAMYKQCIAKSAEQAADVAQSAESESDEDEEEGQSMDAITPAAFLAVVLPHLLSKVQQTMQG